MEINEHDTDTYLQPSREEYNPIRPRYYNIKKNKQEVNLLPITNLVISYDIEFIVDELRQQLKSQYFDLSTITSDKIIRLRPKLRNLLIKFMKNEPIEPIRVIQELNINEPSLLNPDRPSVLGLETALLQHPLRYVDHIYRPIEGDDRIAMSIFFKYDHIPITITA